jgi:ABC-type uncharacterized transport system substrate-binding protein
MQLIALTAVLALALTLAPFTALAQQPERVYRVGFVSLGGHPPRHGMWHQLLEALRSLNYVEGQNLVVKLGLTEGRPERLPGLIADLIQAKVDVIVTTSTLRRRRRRRRRRRFRSS